MVEAPVPPKKVSLSVADQQILAGSRHQRIVARRGHGRQGFSADARDQRLGVRTLRDEVVARAAAST
jgi:hypothetical protein